MKKLFDRIFSSRIALGKLVISILGFILGMSLILGATEVYLKVDEILNSRQTSNYLILNKKVSLVSNTIFNSKTEFSSKQLAEIKEQPFIRDMSPVVSSQYKIRVKIKNMGFTTDAFFESVPERFIDKIPTKFYWAEGDKTIPIIIPREYVHLYNFGFAQSQNLPQVPASAIKTLPGRAEIKDYNGEKTLFDARVVGFSDRIPTVLVPESFNLYANTKFADPTKKNIVSRVLVEVTNPSDPELKAFLEENGYQTNNDKLDSGKAGLIVGIVMGIVLVFGFCFITLSILNIILSFSLVISESKNEVRQLLELGYTSKMIAGYFFRYLLIVIGVEVVVSVVIFLILNIRMNNYLEDMSYELVATIHGLSLALGVLLVLLNAGIFWRGLNRVLRRY